MNIFYLEWNSFCNEDMFEALQELGHHVIKIPFEGYGLSKEEIAERLDEAFRRYTCDFLFSFNYFPKVSAYCAACNVKYVSWIYDSPHIHAYSYTILNPCNYIFIFDHAMYEELSSMGIQTVYYMPLAVNDKRLGRLVNSTKCRDRYACDVSFVGSLYSEPKHRLYDKFQALDSFTKGYLDGLIRAQLQVRECNFLRDMLTTDIVQEMQKVYPTNPNAETVLPPEDIYADYVLARQVTSVERREILELLGKEPGRNISLYTYDSGVQLSGVANRGKVDYYEEMPYVFLHSKINLNITLRSIKSGIPLRAFDIMGSGGFLMTNYQQEMFEYFTVDEDFVYYSDYEDLLDKVNFYLCHEEERKRIAQNGCCKVREQHNIRHRLQDILAIVMGD